MEQIKVGIIGGGVVGCAIAHELSASIDDVFLFEAAPKLGMMTSSRNSGVLHAGISYAPGTLKAKLCAAGNRLSQEFCVRHGVPFRRCGKLVVALDLEETPELEKLAEMGRGNGVEGLRLIGRDRIQVLEPNITAVAALEVPSTAVVNPEELVKAYAAAARAQGANLLTDARIVAVEPGTEAIEVSLERSGVGPPGTAARETFEVRCLINAAGLYADEIAQLAGEPAPYRIYPLRGEYARVRRARAELVRALVYPVAHGGPDRGSLSRRAHLTRTVEGDLLIGPTARYVESKTDYENDRLPVEEFMQAALPLLPQLGREDLQPAFSGLRPQLVPPGQTGRGDFIIERSAISPQLIHLIGMESPALTSAPAIAQHVAAWVRETLA